MFELTLPIGDAPKVGDVGKLIRIDTGVDISAGSTLEMVFRKPDGAITTVMAVPTAGQNTKMDFTSPAGFWDQGGNWQVQGHVVLAGPQDLRTGFGTFYVGKQLG